MTVGNRRSDERQDLVQGVKGRKSQPSVSARTSEDDCWTMRPKRSASLAGRVRADGLKAADILHPGYIHDRRLAVAPADHFEERSRSKRWLALSLAGVIYAVGFAGIWSMAGTFDRPLPPSITPAGDKEILPPLDDAVDVRDAGLESPIHPERRPAIDGEASDEVVASDPQLKI